jgi:glycosyltransferase involved in cell wall biosynthesis
MQDKTPLVSVTICCYNSERYIAQTVQSVLDQTFSDFELIIVNDGSTDRTEEIVRGFDDPRIHYQYQENRGLAATRNRTLELAQGKYIAFLDHDDLWVPEKLALQIPLMEVREDIAVVYGNAATIDADGNVISENWADFKPRDGNIFADLLIQGDFINWQTVVMRRSVLESLGGFRPYKVVEDYDILLRCAVDHNFVGIDRVLAQYRWHGSNFTALRKEVEIELEVVELKEYWLANLPPQHRELILALRREIASRHYRIGNSLCREGNIRSGWAHLRQARLDSLYAWRVAIKNTLVGLLGPRYHLHVVRWKRRLLGLTDHTTKTHCRMPRRG